MSRIGRLATPLLTVLLAATACTSTDPAPEAGDVGLAVEYFASPNPGSVNSYRVFGPDGLVVIDALRTVPDAESAVAEARATGQNVAAILITHAHPDHVGGLGVWHEAFPDAPIHASGPTTKTMAEDSQGFYELTRGIEAPGAFPAEITVPDRLIEPGATLTGAGLDLTTAQFGPGETETSTVFYDPDSKSLFSGDLINNGATPALLEGHTCGWLTDLDRLRRDFPDAATIYPGHGAPGPAAELIDAQRDYLTFVRTLVHAAVAKDSPEGDEVTDAERATAVAAIEAEYPGYPPVASLPDLHAVNIDAVAAELRASDPGAEPEVCRMG